MSAGDSIVVVGAGGLGCPVALGLVEAGHAIRLVDDDTVELSNLQRQVLYGVPDLGRPKVEVARERLLERFPDAAIATARARLDWASADELLGGARLVVDATDDPTARFVVNDWALAHGVPAVLGGIHRFQGLVMGVAPGAACFRCLFEEDQAGTAETCAQVGVLGALAGLVGHLQVERALALLAGDPTATGFVTTIDALLGRARHVAVARADDCQACGARPAARRSALQLTSLSS
ncbi:MAG: HesA/MoeB/ThiF family protein [Myxococcota bacterium]